MDNKSTVGSVIHELRKAKGLSVKDLAQASNISSSMLSQLERGNANPSINTLREIASVLDVPLFRLFMEESNDTDMVVRANSRRRVQLDSDSISYELLTPNLNGDIEFATLTLASGQKSSLIPLSHRGEEVSYIEQGSLIVHVESHTIELNKGDSIRIPANAKHYWENISTADATVIFAITPPSF